MVFCKMETFRAKTIQRLRVVAFHSLKCRLQFAYQFGTCRPCATHEDSNAISILCMPIRTQHDCKATNTAIEPLQVNNGLSRFFSETCKELLDGRQDVGKHAFFSVSCLAWRKLKHHYVLPVNMILIGTCNLGPLKQKPLLLTVPYKAQSCLSPIEYSVPTAKDFRMCDFLAPNEPVNGTSDSEHTLDSLPCFIDAIHGGIVLPTDAGENSGQQ